MTEETTNNDRKGLILGFVLIFVGLAMLVDNLDIAVIGNIWQFWPIAVLAVGVVKITSGNLHTGLFLMLLSVWFGLVSFQLFGLGWANSWPLAIIAGGLATLVAPDPCEATGAPWIDRLSGFVPIGIGFWLFAVTNRMWDLSWSSSWPPLLILAGIGIILKGVGITMARSMVFVVDLNTTNREPATNGTLEQEIEPS